jgi:ribosomal protection tetracycline resistance protein
VRTLNLGILAHVDAGKTSLTERLLYAAGVIDEIGSVDDGSTQTDSMALERQRGITIRSAVVSFVIEDVTVNLIDTPGHPDFIAEVERVFVNKIDRGGAGDERVLRDIATRLTPAIFPMGPAVRLGTPDAAFTPSGQADADFTAGLAELLADHDDAFLAAYLAAPVPYGELRATLAAQTARALVHPVFFGSAITGAGVQVLTSGIRELLPATDSNLEGPVSGTVFKVERGAAGEKIGYVRMFSGAIRTRDRLRFGADGTGKVTAISVFECGPAVRRGLVAAGQIAKLWGLDDIRVGDAICRAPARAGAPERADARVRADGREHPNFAPPSLETIVVPVRRTDKGVLHVALTQLAEQDPLINLRQDDTEVAVSLYGEVQKEVIQATLADEFGVAVTFRETTTLHIERPAGTGAAVETIGVPPNPFLAGVGLRVEPAPDGAGVKFRMGIELGSLPPAFLKAVEETVTETLRQGLYGWQVTDCVVTITHSGYYPRQSHAHATFDKSMSSTAGDFRNLTPLVLMSALKQANTRVHEPMHRFRLEIPADVAAALPRVLASLRAVRRTSVAADASYVMTGDIPAAMVHELERQLPALTRGEGVLESGFDHHQQVRGVAPARQRTDHNPLDRKEYLLHVMRRV